MLQVQGRWSGTWYSSTSCYHVSKSTCISSHSVFLTSFYKKQLLSTKARSFPGVCMPSFPALQGMSLLSLFLSDMVSPFLLDSFHYYPNSPFHCLKKERKKEDLQVIHRHLPVWEGLTQIQQLQMPISTSEATVQLLWLTRCFEMVNNTCYHQNKTKW